MATVAAVYDTAPVPRTPVQIIRAPAATNETNPTDGPHAINEWLYASVVHDAATVISRVFDEVERRDPDHQRTWVALVSLGRCMELKRVAPRMLGWPAQQSRLRVAVRAVALLAPAGVLLGR